MGFFPPILSTYEHPRSPHVLPLEVFHAKLEVNIHFFPPRAHDYRFVQMLPITTETEPFDPEASFLPGFMGWRPPKESTNLTC